MLPALPRILAQATTAPSSQPAIDAITDTVKSTFADLSRVSWFGWGILLIGVLAGVVVGRIVQSVLRRLGDRVGKHGWCAQQTLLQSAIGPAGLAILTLGLSAGLAPVLEVISEGVRTFALHVLAFLYVISVGWLLYNLVELVDIWLQRLASHTASKLDDQIAPLIRKTLRVFLVVVFTLFVAENIFGANIGSWLAGLGIAGLAVSLAAQDSVKNFFGSITILMDRPFAVGDLITFAGQTGSVSEIGFRSTRIWTLDGALVTIPNAKIVDNEVTNIGRRKSIRRVMDVTITYDTSPEKIEEAVKILKEIMAEPAVEAAFDMEKTPPRVYFNELNADSLNIKVFYWFTPPDYWSYMAHAQHVNLLLFKRYAEAGIEFAFPTQTLYLAGDEKRELQVTLNDQRAE